jgi:hypothetical protein
MEEQQTPKKLSRNELLARAREAKAKKAEFKKQMEMEKTEKEISSIIQETPKKKKQVKAKVEIKELPIKNDDEPEIIEEIVRIPATRKKKIVKRTIETEESETDEEIQEEIIKIPKAVKAKQEIKPKVETEKERIKGRLMNELFS